METSSAHSLHTFIRLRSLTTIVGIAMELKLATDLVEGDWRLRFVYPGRSFDEDVMRRPRGRKQDGDHYVSLTFFPGLGHAYASSVIVAPATVITASGPEVSAAGRYPIPRRDSAEYWDWVNQR